MTVVLVLSTPLLKLYVRDEKEPLHFLYALELLDFTHPVCQRGTVDCVCVCVCVSMVLCLSLLPCRTEKVKTQRICVSTSGAWRP